MVTCADDVLELYFGGSDNYRGNVSSAVNKRLMLEKEDDFVEKDIPQRILDLIYLEPLNSDEISVRLNVSVSEVLKVATGLCVMGTVIEKDGKYYAN
jgi:predicted Rossmann fold nucleotide-binding protein DprA/Smf involved in DNA uptake